MEKVRTIGLQAERPLIRNQLVTREDLQQFKRDLLVAIQAMLSQATTPNPKKWLKSYEIKKILNISNGTLQTLRSNGTIPFSKIGGIIYYDAELINQCIENNKRLFHKNWKPD